MLQVVRSCCKLSAHVYLRLCNTSCISTCVIQYTKLNLYLFTERARNEFIKCTVENLVISFTKKLKVWELLISFMKTRGAIKVSGIKIYIDVWRNIQVLLNLAFISGDHHHWLPLIWWFLGLGILFFDSSIQMIITNCRIVSLVKVYLPRRSGLNKY